MGYSHYWHRQQMIADDFWHRIRGDFEKLVLPLNDLGVVLAGGLGTGPPEITAELIRFNGPADCGHPANEELVIPYPTDEADGVGPSTTAIVGDFYGVGVLVKHRCCNGSCCYETFTLQKSMELHPGDEPEEHGLYIEYVKTGFRPYDVAVTATLLIAKRHLGDRFIINSNGADAQWSDARRLCQEVLGYGDWFGIIEKQVRSGRNRNYERSRCASSSRHRLLTFDPAGAKCDFLVLCRFGSRRPAPSLAKR
jgi:hypothetical protein